jgi:hypothetical protein
MEKTLTAGDLRQFTGTETWYRHSLNGNFLYTDGARYVADKGGAYWLIDEIALAQRYQPNVMKQAFQLWKLLVSEESTGVLTCADGNGATVYEKAIPYTDFPLPEITFYYTNCVLLLPSEY